MEIALNHMGVGAKKIMTRINDNGNVVGTIIVNTEGFPETTTLDSLTAATYSTHMRSLSMAAKNALKEISEASPRRCSAPLYGNADALPSIKVKKEDTDVADDLVVLRLVSRKAEAVVAPDNEFHLIVVMRRS